MVNEQHERLSSKEKLLHDLENREYRQGFVEAHAKDTVAFQLRAPRQGAGWEQRDVARKLGNEKLQPMISRYENPDYGRYSIATLLELAKVFDVALVVRFAPFSELAEWDLNSKPESVCPPSYLKDTRLKELAASLRFGGSNKPYIHRKFAFHHRRPRASWRLPTVSDRPGSGSLSERYHSPNPPLGAAEQQLLFKFETTPVRKDFILEFSNRASAPGAVTHRLPAPLSVAAGAGGYYGQ